MGSRQYHQEPHIRSFTFRALANKRTACFLHSKGKFFRAIYSEMIIIKEGDNIYIHIWTRINVYTDIHTHIYRIVTVILPVTNNITLFKTSIFYRRHMWSNYVIPWRTECHLLFSTNGIWLMYSDYRWRKVYFEGFILIKVLNFKYSILHDWW